MKKIIKIIMLLILMPINIKALTPTVSFQDGVYRHAHTWKSVYTKQLRYLYLNEEPIFTLGPFEPIGTNYILDDTAYSFIDLDYIKLVVHYGYYSHPNDVYYYMATQDIIWRENSTITNIYWTTEESSSSTEIRIDEYKRDILNKVAKAYLKPNFNIDNVTGDYGDIIELNDTNDVLEDFEIINETKNEVWKEKNKLFIKILDNEGKEIKFVKKIKSGKETHGYKSKSYVPLATFSIDKTVESSLSITPNPYKTKIKITRYVEDELVEEKIKFKIFNVKTSKFIEVNGIDTFETDDKGNFISDFKLDIGTYEIFNVEIPSKYIFNDRNISFQIKESNRLNNYIYEINDYLYLPYGVLKLYKNKLYSSYEIPGKQNEIYLYANQNIYDEKYNLIYYKNSLIAKLITDENGYVEYKLPLGEYYILDGENKYDFNLEYKDEFTKEIVSIINIEEKTDKSNILIDVKLKKNNNGEEEISDLNDLSYDIYSAEDIYIDSKLIYQKDEFIYRITSNTSREITLPNGKYYIKERENSYEDKFETYYFDYIGDDINLKIIKKDKQNKEEYDENFKKDYTIENNLENTNNKLPDTYNYIDTYYKIGIAVVIFGITFMFIYEIVKKN